jgi:hypothetical protein
MDIGKTDLAVANRASANESPASGVAESQSTAALDSAPASSDANSITLFNIQTKEQYDGVIRQLCHGSGVAPWVTGAWDRNRIYRMTQGIDQKMLDAMNRREGIYSGKQIEQIRAMKSSSVYPLMIDKMCRRAEAYVADAFSSVERPDKLRISGEIELTKDQRREILRQLEGQVRQAVRASGGAVLPPERVESMLLAIEDNVRRKLMQRAKLAAGSMENVIYGQLDEGGWRDAFDGLVSDAITLKGGVIYGPYATVDNEIHFFRGKNGKTGPVARKVYRYRWDRRSPFDIFPAAGCRTLNEGDLVDRVRWTPENLLAQAGQPGWDKDAINSVVTKYHEQGFAYFTGFDSARGYAEEIGNVVQRQYGFIECLRFYGHVRGDRLEMTGVPGDTRQIMSNALYHVCSVVCGSDVLYVSVLDPDIDFRPYLFESYAPKCGGLWGKGFGELAASEDAMQAAAARGTVNNAGFVTTPTRTIYSEQLVGGVPLGAAYPGQTYIAKFIPGATQKPVEYHQIPNSMKTLAELREDAEKYAHEMVGVPLTDLGSGETSSVGRTATGFAEIEKNASRSMAFFLYRLEKNVWRPNIDRLNKLNILYHEDESIKTEAEVIPQGVFAELDRRANASRKMEVLNAVRGDPIVTPRKRAALIQSIGEDAEIPSDALPSEDDIAKAEAEEAQQKAMAAQAQQAQSQPMEGAA